MLVIGPDKNWYILEVGVRGMGVRISGTQKLDSKPQAVDGLSVGLMSFLDFTSYGLHLVPSRKILAAMRREEP